MLPCVIGAVCSASGTGDLDEPVSLGVGSSATYSVSATVTGVLLAKIRSGPIANSSAAWSRNACPSPAQRYSIERVRPLTHPSSRKPFSNATTRDCASGSPATRPISTPIRRICFVCARTGTGVKELLDVAEKLLPNPMEGNRRRS